MRRWRTLNQLRDDFKASGIDLGRPIKRNPATRGCAGKVRHPTAEHAQAVIDEIRLTERRDHPSRHAKLCTYRCSWCRFWHIGHDNRKPVKH